MGTRVLIVGLLALLAACGEQEPPTERGAGSSEAAGSRPGDGAGAPLGTHPVADEQTLRAGRELFTQHCAQCHGDNGQGAPEWQKPGPDGKYPPPPLNGTGHAWHHPMPALRQTIAFGTQRIGGSMPPWKDRLSPEQIDAIIYWFQSQWPQELYQAWEEMDARAGKRG